MVNNFIKILFLFYNHKLAISVSTVFFSLNVFCAHVAFSQAISSTDKAHSLELRVANLEQQYDSQLMHILSNYFDRRKFFVDVNITGEIVEETNSTVQDQVAPKQPQQNLFMPGLPLLPEENRKIPSSLSAEPEQVISYNTVKTLRLVSMSVNIYADTSFKAKQLELMRFITGIAIKTDQQRGDEIFISQLEIPDYSAKPEPITAATLSPQSSIPDLNSLITYAPALALMLLFGLTILFNHIVNKPPSQISIKELRDTIKNDYASKLLVDQRPNYRPEKEFVPEIGPNETNNDDIIEAFFNKPEEIASIFRYWISEEENGVNKAVQVMVATDKQLLRTLKYAIHPEDYELISEQLNEPISLTPLQRIEIIDEFGEMLRKGSKESISERIRNKLSLFKFIDHLPERYIIALLESEDSLSGALILHYLPDDSAASLIEKIDKEIAAKILVKVSLLNNLTTEQQRTISNGLFEKAMRLVDQKRSEQFGAEHLYPILEKIPIFEQKRYIDELKATGSIVGAILYSKFITIDMLAEIDKDIIKRAVSSFNTETLLDAVIGLNEYVVEKILSTRPKREQRLLRMELNELKDVDISKTEYAKSRLMKLIRLNADR